jgi:hypothetical protein
MTMGTDEGFEILRRAIESATSRTANDYLLAVAKGPQYLPELRHVAAGVQRAVDAAGHELAALGLNGIEIQVVLAAIVRGTIAPPYHFPGDDDPL